MRRYEISDATWERIQDLFPGKAGDVGRTAHSYRRFAGAVLWIARNGAPWRDLTERYGHWNSVYRRFNCWVRKGLWQRIFAVLQDPDLQWLMLDSTVVRAHQHTAGQKKHQR